MPAKIAMFSWESLHSIAVGGLARHVSQLAAALRRLGHDVHVFTRMDQDQSNYACIDGVHYHRCAFEPHPDFVTYVERMCNSFVARLHEAEAFYGQDFDVVHGHDWLAAKALVQAKNTLGRRTVLTMHATEFGRCGNTLCNGQSSRVRDIEWEGTYVADRVICVSGALLEEIRWLYSVPTEKTHVVYNGVDVHRFDAEVDTRGVRARYGIGPDDPVVLFVGRMAWQKGPDLLLEAMPGLNRYYPGAKFVFVGDGDMRATLEERIARVGLGSATRFLGYRDGRELVSLFRSADVVCVPSRNEPFGIVILEAWSAEKPVVATRNGGPAEFVRHGETGLVVYANTDSIGWGLGTALADRADTQRMGRNGRHLAESRFSWDVIAAQTEEVYEKL